jgi:hypothetical protein
LRRRSKEDSLHINNGTKTINSLLNMILVSEGGFCYVLPEYVNETNSSFILIIGGIQGIPSILLRYASQLCCVELQIASTAVLYVILM